MMDMLNAVRRADGMLDYSKDGPGAFKNVLPPVFEKLEGQLEANNVYRCEIEISIRELNLFGAAVISFSERRCDFSA